MKPEINQEKAQNFIQDPQIAQFKESVQTNELLTEIKKGVSKETELIDNTDVVQAIQSLNDSISTLNVNKSIDSFRNSLGSIDKLVGKKGEKGDKGKDGKSGKDGAKGSDGKDGTNGIDGVDGVNAQVDENLIIDEVVKKLPMVGAEIRDSLELITVEEDKLKISAIGFLQEKLDKIKQTHSFIGGSTKMFVGEEDGTPENQVNRIKFPNGSLTLNPDSSMSVSFAGGLPKNNYTAIIPPTATDDSTQGYTVGSAWIDTVADERYILLDSTATLAVWVKSTVGTATEVVNTPAGTISSINVQSALNELDTEKIPYTGATGTVDLGVNNFIVNTNDLFVDTSTGRVGIGTTTPSGKLHIKQSSAGTITPNIGANGLVIENSGYSGISIYGGTTGASQIFFGDSGGDVMGAIQYVHSGDYMAFTTNAIVHMTLTSLGRIGIGTTTPTQKLDINGNIALTGSIGGNGLIGTATTFYGSLSDTKGLTIKGGSVGIGTATPSYNLSVVGTDTKISASGSTGAAIHLTKTGTANTWSEWQQTGLSTRLNASDGTTTITDVITILNTGNIGIGVTAPTSKLYVSGTTSFIGNNYIKGTSYIDPNNFGGVASITLAIGDTDTGLHSTGDGQLNLYSNSVNVMSIRGVGVGIGTATPTSPLQVVGLPVYANNAAAIIGGLTVGAFYRTGADPDPVNVVH